MPFYTFPNVSARFNVVPYPVTMLPFIDSNGKWNTRKVTNQELRWVNQLHELEFNNNYPMLATDGAQWSDAQYHLIMWLLCFHLFDLEFGADKYILPFNGSSTGLVSQPTGNPTTGAV